MNSLVKNRQILPTMNNDDVLKVTLLAEEARKIPQVKIDISHSLHAGVYARTAKVPGGVMITGVLIKIPTLLIVVGDCLVYIGERAYPLVGHHVLEAEAHRKQVFVANKDTSITMMFSTKAKTINEAEEEFTDEFDKLQSRYLK